MTIEQIRKNILHIKFPNQYELTSTFIRLQEFYESPFPAIRGKFFTLEQYMDLYAKENGNFTYFSDWSGFNVPGNSVQLFAQKFCQQVLSRKERKMLDLIFNNLDVWNNEGNYYIIATYDNCDVDHELAHGYYYLIPAYKREMNKLYKKFEKSVEFNNSLLKQGYGKKFLKDETQAYLATESIDELYNQFSVKLKKSDVVPFRRLFRLYDVTGG